MESETIEYFPEEYLDNHWGQTKPEVIRKRKICAAPGWSVGLAENPPFMPGPGKGRLMGGRKQLETGQSPNEYRQILKSGDYNGETGLTIEDFITRFLVRLESTGEVSNDIEDHNATWCLTR